ncbi:Rha family transcriptional regulator [Aeromonas veronii]|uniref:Rha family transcriptional regulator n=1 Tax=Aeromonas veronii TaxID=654 RepID=UPI003F794D96
MHLFEGLAVVQGEFQFMSGHVLFLIPFLACLMVETAAAGQGSVARGHNHDHSIRIGQCELQVVAAYQLPLIGDCLSTLTLSWEESLSQTGRGPALRAFTLVVCELTLLANESYSVGAAAKSAAGICTPSSHLELTHALAWFFVSNRPPFFGVLFAYPAIGILSVMVARAGQPSGWPVSSGCAGSANPVRATTMRFAPLVGSDNLSHPEAAIMATIPTPVTPEIRLVNGQAVTTSLALADYFNKQHKNVLAKIQSLDCSPEFRRLNFKPTVYDRPNPSGGAPIPTTCYQLTRDGFCFIAMGFTGRRASEFKERYIAAFNATEATLANLVSGDYDPSVAAKSATGISTPETTNAQTRAKRVFLSALLEPTRFMVARAGEPQGSPGSLVTGSANPARAATLRLAPHGGGEEHPTNEEAVMATTPSEAAPRVQLIDGQAVTTSLDLAAYFGKRHDTVLRKIATLDCSLDFTARNFAASTYTDPTGRSLVCYQLTRDGFCFIAMGFTGRRASEFKERYIAAFNAMERQGHARYLAAPDANALAHSVSEARAFYQMIRMHWESEIYPSLKAVKSPLAYELYDRFEWMSYLLIAIAHQVESHRTAQVVQGGQHEKA